MRQLQVCKWFLLAALLMIGSEGAPESDPWITPIPNLDAAMEGFDPIMSNPFEKPDPGIRKQIFEPMHQLPDGRVLVNSFIDKVREDLHCDAELSSKTLRNYNEYNREKFSSQTFSLNANVTGHSEPLILSFSASAGHGRESTDEERSVQKLFQEANGEIIASKGECITHSVGISLFERPVFTAAFTTALKQLHFASKTPDSESSRRVYVKFVLSYGTHFMTTTFLGSKLIFEKRFTNKPVNSIKQSVRSECVTNSAYASLGGKVMTGEAPTSFEMASKSCESADESKSFFQNKEISAEKVISIGPLPQGGLQKWSNTAKESPVPIHYELEKISILFQSEWFNTITTDDTDPNADALNGTAMYEFFEDNSASYCQLILGKECDVEKKGCGYNSLCSEDETCVSDQSTYLGYACNDLKTYVTAVPGELMGVTTVTAVPMAAPPVTAVAGESSVASPVTAASIETSGIPPVTAGAGNSSRVPPVTEAAGPVLIMGGRGALSGDYLSSGDAIGTRPLPDLPYAVFGGTLAAVGSKIYSCGGYRPGTGFPSSCHVLDRALDRPRWDSIASFPNAISDHTSVTVKEHIWTVHFSKLYDLNTKTNQFHTFYLPLTVSNSHCAVSNGSHSFIIGAGASRNEIWVNTEEYNPAKWHRVGQLSASRRYFGCVWVGREVFITGGQPSMNDAEVFDTVTHAIRSAGTLVQVRYDHKMMVFEGKPAVVGGKNISRVFGSIETYDQRTALWTTSHRSLARVRRSFGLVQLQG